MAIALVTSFTEGSASGNGFTTAAFDDTGANLRIAVVSEQGARDTVLTSNNNNSWTKARQENGGFAAGLQLWYAYNITGTSGSTLTATCTAGNLPAIALASFSGALATDPLDQQAGASNLFQSSIQAGSVTPTNDNQLVIAALGGLSQSETPTIDGGFTIAQFAVAVGSQRLAVGLAYLIQTTAAAANPTYTYSGTENIAINATFKAASGGGGGDPVRGLLRGKLIRGGMLLQGLR